MVERTQIPEAAGDVLSKGYATTGSMAILNPHLVSIKR